MLPPDADIWYSHRNDVYYIFTRSDAARRKPWSIATHVSSGTRFGCFWVNDPKKPLWSIFDSYQNMVTLPSNRIKCGFDGYLWWCAFSSSEWVSSETQGHFWLHFMSNGSFFWICPKMTHFDPKVRMRGNFNPITRFFGPFRSEDYSSSSWRCNIFFFRSHTLSMWPIDQ